MADNAPKGTKLEFEISGKLKGTSVVAAQKGTTVTVENLFNNLPVRRRELERNIKREWAKVVAHLGQYACIQTGIKFSVTQQAGKGKKTTLFSTKGNKTTRENIVNVFGAKTLTALISLDLNLELEPTSGSSQRLSTQEDGDKKEIRIVGHISRPASGEGRQTPDKQMFFVNSRPCTLPQVAKAFNEVYKSYNGSQSPFIFANIELDTHMYDVNVSPDKRTILLHDQNRMLENLKEALVALFESQDYTVPISQLPAQKQPSFKQLTISRENTLISEINSPSVTPQLESSKVPHTLAESARDDEPEHGSQGSSRGRSDNSQGLEKRWTPDSKVATVSRESMGRDIGAVSLISNWLGKKTEDRSDETRGAETIEVCEAEGLSRDKKRLVEKLSKAGQERSDQGVPDRIVSPSVERESSPPLFLRDSTIGRQRSDSVDESEADAEPPIPSLQSPPKPASSIADRFSNTPRSYRPPVQVATITIGDHTVTSSIGTPCPAKRARMDPPSTVRVITQVPMPSKIMPSFGNILSQRFAAPGTATQATSEDDDNEQEVVDPEMDSPLMVESSSDADVDKRDSREDVENDDGIKEEIDDEANDSSLMPTATEDEDGEYIDEAEKKTREEAKVQAMIQDVEMTAAIPSKENVIRGSALLKGGTRRKDMTVNLVRTIDTSIAAIDKQFQTLQAKMTAIKSIAISKSEAEPLDSDKAEDELSLTISKTDFAKMKIVGQFNLGFILASRAAEASEDGSPKAGDDLFIIDQHASDEKYNFERLQATTVVQSQRLVHPKTLDLTAMEEEIVIENLSALETNGFVVSVNTSGESPIGQRCQLISLPLSRETAFSLTDLDELLALLADHVPNSGPVPRPSKVRKMFAMRACRSSVMIGKTLTHQKMGKLVSHLGELDKPWNCPHGRPTMRHLCGLGVWDEDDVGWSEEVGCALDLGAYMRGSRDDLSTSSMVHPEGEDDEVEVEEEGIEGTMTIEEDEVEDECIEGTMKVEDDEEEEEEHVEEEL